MRPQYAILLITICFTVAALVLLGSGSAPYGSEDMVPVRTTADEEDGYARLDDLTRMTVEGGRVEVFRDGELVGYVTRDGYRSLQQ